MFPSKESERGLLPMAQQNHDSDIDSEMEAMSDDEYLKSKPQSRVRRICSSNVPWIFTTITLSLYIFYSASIPQKKDVPWSPTDVGKYISDYNFTNEFMLSLKVYIRNLMEESEKVFTSGLDYNNQNHTLQHTPSEGLRFIGTPNADVDAAWAEIAGGKSQI
jgi:hypothetical protein